MARKPTPSPTPRRAETFNERTERLNREIAATNARTGAKPAAKPAPRRAAEPLPPSRYGQSTVPGNVPRPAAGPADARSPRDIPLGRGMVGQARDTLVNRGRNIDAAVDKADPPKPSATPRPRNMAGGGKVCKSKGKK